MTANQMCKIAGYYFRENLCSTIEIQAFKGSAY